MIVKYVNNQQKKELKVVMNSKNIFEKKTVVINDCPYR